MRYLAIQRAAAEEIVGSRLMQSTDFDEGKALRHILSEGTPEEAQIGARLMFSPSQSRSGGIITCIEANGANYIVFDLEQSKLFEASQTPSEAMQCLQRVLRFAVKYWDKRVLSPSEILYPAHRRAVVFPFPISQKTGFRISIDTDPDSERLRKRNLSGRHLLVYKAGTEEGQGPKEMPSVTVFRKFLEELPKIEVRPKPLSSDTGAEIASFQNVSLAQPSGRLDIHQGYDAWMRVLTADQRRFVEMPIDSPIRIEGPAGTGKTLCLALKAVRELRRSEIDDCENSILFITHSEASRKSIRSVLESMDAGRFISPASPRRVLKLETLQGLCADILRQELSATELLDSDAYDAKQLQLMYVEEAYNEAKLELPTYSKFMSPEFSEFVAREDDWLLIQMLQHEVGVVIKGRANEQFDSYKKVPALRAGLPVRNEGDKSFVWRVYELYREQLISGAQFDTDDVMLSAIGQLGTPIWRRRRNREGYDGIFIDETHLFNMNELSVFHFLTKRDDKYQIVFAVDRSQAIGDRGWDSDFDVDALVPEHPKSTAPSRVRISTVFRSSPEIVNLAFSVTSSGANLFTNFEDPLAMANSSLTFEEERMCSPPVYRSFDDDGGLIDGAFYEADRMVREMSTSRGNVAIIAFTDELFHALTAKAEQGNKPVELLKERGDLEIVKRAQLSGRFVLTMPDYVGGLEFDAAVLVGVDEGRVPPSISVGAETKAFLDFNAHNRLYVAITRARYRIIILGVRARGPSSVLKSAINTGALLVEKET